jgi:predicted ArsR family transcriptional regulator
MKKQPNNPIPVEFFTPAQLAEELGAHERTIRRHAAELADAGKIAPRHPRGWLFSPTDADVIRALDMSRGRPEKLESELSPRQLRRRQKKSSTLNKRC